MDKKDFNRSLGKYLAERTTYKKTMTLADFKSKIMPNFEKIKIKPKFKETDIEFIDHDELDHVEPKKTLFARLFCRKKKEKPNVVDEEMNPVSEEQALQQSKDFEFEVQVENDINEFDKELEEIEQVERQQRKRFHFLHSLMSRLKFKNKLLKKETSLAEEEAEFYEEKQDDIKDELRTVLDFSVDILKLLSAKDFQWLKEKESFQSYKKIIRKYMPSVKKDSE